MISPASRGDPCNPSNCPTIVVIVNHVQCCKAHHSGQDLWQETGRFGAVTLHGSDIEVVGRRTQRKGAYRDKMLVRIMGC